MKFDEFDQYSENMLMAQYDVSEIISHELMKGEVREDFLIATLESSSDPIPKLVKGTISDGTDDAGQVDIILCRPYAQLRKVGNQYFIAKDDALCVIEVKGHCTGTDLKEAEGKAVLIKALEGERTPQYGVVCYKAALQHKTIMKRFGYSFDKENNTFFDNATIPNEVEANWNKIEYPNLDFFVSLEDGQKVVLRKYEIEPGKHRFVRIVSPPIIKEVFSMMRSLWIPANLAPAPAAVLAVAQ